MSTSHQIALITPQRLLEVLSHHVGAENGVSITRLVAEMLRPLYAPVPSELPGLERHVRQLVVDQRFEGAHICSHPSQGYYMARTPEELDATCEFLFERARTSLAQIAAMRRVSLPDLRGQLHLPT